MQDTITSRGDRVTINTGAGDDSLSSTGAQVIINAGGGDDTIDAQGDNNSIDGGAGYDFVTSAGDNATIVNAEEVTISGTGNLVKMKGGDIIFGFESDTGTVQADFVSATYRGQDVILTDAQGGEITVAGAKGKPININGVETVISAVCQNASTGEEFVNISEALTYASAGDTLELLKDFNENVTVSQDVTFAGPGTYSGNLALAGAGVTIGGQSLPVTSGNVYTSFDGTNFGNIASDYGYFTNNTPNITITTHQPGNFTNNGDNVTITALNNNNTITNTGDNVTISAWRNNNTITNNGDNVTITASNSNNTITNNGANDSIQVGQSGKVTNTGAAATIIGGASNNTFTNSGANVSISALNGSSNTITNTAEDVTIKVEENAAAVISSSDYLKTNVQLTYSAVTVSGNSVIFNPTVSAKKVTLQNANAKVICANGDFTMYGAAANNSTANYTWYTSPTFITTTAANNAASVKILTATSNDSGLNKTLVSAGDNVTIAGTIKSSSFLADASNNWIYGRGDKALVYLGATASSKSAGDDHVYWTGDYFTLKSMYGDDQKAHPMTQNVTVIGNNYCAYDHSAAVCLYLVGNNASARNSAICARQVTIIGNSNNLAVNRSDYAYGPCVIRGDYNNLQAGNDGNTYNNDNLQVTISGNNNELVNSAYQGVFVESGSNNTLFTACKSAFITLAGASSNTVIKVGQSLAQSYCNHTISGWKADDCFYCNYTTDYQEPTRSGNVVTMGRSTFNLQDYSGSVKCQSSTGSYYYI